MNSYVSIYFQENLLQRLKATRSNHLISGTLWDHNSASQFLYISSTSQEKGEGTHRVYDVAKARMMCVLNNDMAGEALAFSTQGKFLLLKMKGSYSII